MASLNSWGELDSYLFPADAFQNSRRDGIRTEAFVVMRDGKILYERYTPQHPAEQRQLVWSMTKSVSNLLFGIAQNKGLIHQDDLISKYVPLSGSESPELGRLRLRDLLNWSSGISWSEVYELNPLKSSVLAMLYSRGSMNMGDFVRRQNFRYSPGVAYSYSSGDTNLLMKALKAAVPAKDYDAFPWVELFNPLGISSAVFEQDASGVFVGSSYLYLTAHDALKLGHFILQGGVINGKHLLPDGWLEESVQIVPAFRAEDLSRRSGVLHPGKHFWINRSDPGRRIPKALRSAPEDLIVAQGHWGQFLGVVPSQNLVIVRFADDRDRSFSQEKMFEILMRELHAEPVGERP
jgi:CubicO group peptidase (beta-lactamase class C family)